MWRVTWGWVNGSRVCRVAMGTETNVAGLPRGWKQFSNYRYLIQESKFACCYNLLWQFGIDFILLRLFISSGKKIHQQLLQTQFPWRQKVEHQLRYLGIIRDEVSCGLTSVPVGMEWDGKKFLHGLVQLSVNTRAWFQEEGRRSEWRSYRETFVIFSRRAAGSRKTDVSCTSVCHYTEPVRSSTMWVVSLYAWCFGWTQVGKQALFIWRIRMYRIIL